MPKTPQAPANPELPGLAELDRLLEHRSRLGAAVLIAREGRASFTELKLCLGETDGNLGAHLKKLECAGYIGVRKIFIQRRPVSFYRLTKPGKKKLKSHLGALDALIAEGAR